MEIEGKVAIITGAGGGGQGRAVARRLASLRARVVVSDVNDAGGQETCRRIAAEGGTAAFVHADVANEADVRAMCLFAEERFGGLDILVNNAGPYLPGDRLKHWNETLSANLLGSIYATLHAIEPMRRRGGGAIVYYGSTSAVGHGLKHCASPAYDVAKAAVMRLATTMSWLRDEYGIRVNCIVPDWVATEEVQAYFDSLSPEERVANGVPHELTSLDDIARAVVRLISDEALSGRILVWWSGKPPGLIPVGDRGFERLEPF
jgi:NAD(P)-dependent dehydrogenase (short-subunit alcohol dehydrogenase family)